MSIPDRLWRVVKGQWALAEERRSQAADHADAYAELAEALQGAPASRLPPPAAGLPPVLPPPQPATSSGLRDPLEACYALLSVEPGATLEVVQSAYESRLKEICPERYTPGTPERKALDARQAAVQAAYGRLRDMLNPTETRFEHLEF